MGAALLEPPPQAPRAHARGYHIPPSGLRSPKGAIGRPVREPEVESHIIRAHAARMSGSRRDRSRPALRVEDRRLSGDGVMHANYRVPSPH